MKLCLCQMNIVWENKASNIAKVESFCEKAAQKGADLVLFPEMSLTGFSQNIAATKEDGESVYKISLIAKKYNVAIGIGWVKDCGEKGENRYTVVDKNGNVLSEYTKLHPFSYSGEDKNFNCGEGLSTFKFEGFNIGTLICYDLRFPEVFQALSKKADIIVLPACWPEKRSEHWKVLLRARAIENQCYIAAVNCVGDVGGLHYSGDSAVVNPDGKVLCTLSDREGLLMPNIDNDVNLFRACFPTKKDRRVDLYRKLL